jgi:hypothetical protein
MYGSCSYDPPVEDSIITYSGEIALSYDAGYRDAITGREEDERWNVGPEDPIAYRKSIWYFWGYSDGRKQLN